MALVLQDAYGQAARACRTGAQHTTPHTCPQRSTCAPLRAPAWPTTRVHQLPHPQGTQAPRYPPASRKRTSTPRVKPSRMVAVLTKPEREPRGDMTAKGRNRQHLVRTTRPRSTMGWHGEILSSTPPRRFFALAQPATSYLHLTLCVCDPMQSRVQQPTRRIPHGQHTSPMP